MTRWRAEYDDGIWRFYRDGIELPFSVKGDIVVDALNKAESRIAKLKELLDTESQLSNQFYLLLVDNPKSKKLADDLIEALRINGKEVQE